MPKRWIIGGVCAVFMSVGLLTCLRHAAAEQPTKPGKIVITDVIVTGNQRMSTDQIKTRLRTLPNKKYNPAIVDDDVRELYKTGQFSNITTWLYPDGIDRAKIYFGVREMPNMVQKVTFLGARHIKQEELQNITGVQPNTPLNPYLNRQGCQKILDKYTEMGRPLSDCQLMKGGDRDDTEVVYQITEGPRGKVRDIQLVGHTFASAARLRQKIPLQVDGAYNRESAEAGINELCTFYRGFGYRDVRVDLEIERDSAPDEICLIYHIHEGPRYRAATNSEAADPASGGR